MRARLREFLKGVTTFTVNILRTICTSCSQMRIRFSHLQAYAGMKTHASGILIWTHLVFHTYLCRKMIYQQILNCKCLGEEVQRRKLQTFKCWRIGAGSLVWWVDESISDAHRLAQGHSEASSYSFVLLHTIFQQDCESEPTTTASAVTFCLSRLPPSNMLTVSSRRRNTNQVKQTHK